MFTNKSNGIKDRNLQVPDCLEVSNVISMHLHLNVCIYIYSAPVFVYIYSAPVFVYITLKTLVPFMTLKFIWRPGKVTDRLKIKRSLYAGSGSSRLMFRLFILFS